MKQNEKTLVLMENLLAKQLDNAPLYGSIGIKLIFHNGNLTRVMTNNEISLNINSDESQKIFAVNF